jgi:hypothetical protein
LWDSEWDSFENLSHSSPTRTEFLSADPSLPVHMFRRFSKMAEEIEWTHLGRIRKTVERMAVLERTWASYPDRWSLANGQTARQGTRFPHRRHLD